MCAQRLESFKKVSLAVSIPPPWTPKGIPENLQGSDRILGFDHFGGGAARCLLRRWGLVKTVEV